MRRSEVVMIENIQKIKMGAGMRVIEVEVNGQANGVENGDGLVARLNIITITTVPLNETGTGIGRSDEMRNQRKKKCKLERKI
jgi:hypothetical protein